ncbi:toprim domain-containing protein [Novosphingobium sp. SL115]|uniref:toprim domain-containing protein n=1 Tax=Novosphingobium sp. SL115 TaxID=2995150 RepID=UPI0022759EEE|nr:toprim domain-containing protein [Novosphingobium sp. SL115]MCY1672142.1 toprim domain-containing protein [Novosphingobium sp. SL115]
MILEAEILKGLQAQFQFRKTKGQWLQEGKCPQCGRREAFCAAKDPKVVRCGRADNCGWTESVRSILPDLFEDWSKRFPETDENPTATADAYLSCERHLDLRLLRGAYTQEVFRCPKTHLTSASIRFKVGDTYWERLIDRVNRFEKKAHFKAGGSYRGHCWIPPRLTMEDIARADDILFAEGVFDATALCQVKRVAVSAMSTNNWPEHFLADLRAELERIGRTTRPRLIFAFDVGDAGTKATRKFVKQARAEGWEATAMQVRPDGEGTKKDWNDLLIEHLDWNGDAEKAPLGPKAFDEFLYNGKITIAETAYDKAKLIVDRKLATARSVAGFDFRFRNRIWWCRVRVEKDEHGEGQRQIEIEEISNCAFRLLYRERDEVADESNFFLQVDFPTAQPTVKARFSSAACANSGEFKKRLMAFAGTWRGTGEQLDRIIAAQTQDLKVVEPISFTGYSRPHRTWVLGDIAVREGRTISVNKESYFNLGKQAVKLRSPERMLDIAYDPDRIRFEWVPELWTAYGPKGFVALAFFTMSLFAVQIREKHKSLGFLEITGMPGSGKSTMVEFLWKLLGRADYEGDDPNKGTVAFLARTLMKASNLPVGLIEGRRDDDKRTGKAQFDYNELLVLYNGRSPRGTGQKTGGFETISPPFLGSIYLMQNERIDAIPAVLERLMSMSIDKSRWNDATKLAAVRLEQWPIEDVSGTIVHVIRKEADYLPFFFDRYSHHDGDMGKRVQGLHNARPIKCHSQLAAAVEALPELFPGIRPEWIVESLQQVDAMALDRQESAGGDHPLVADFWEKVDYLISREDPTAHEEGKSINQSRSPDRLMAVNLPQFESRCHHAGLRLPNMDVLKKVLRGSHSRKWLANKNVNAPGNRSVPCWVFEQPAKPERIV